MGGAAAPPTPVGQLVGELRGRAWRTLLPHPLTLCVPADPWTFPESALQKVPSDRELSRLASRLGAEWESVLLDLGLSAETLFRCRADHPLSSHGSILAALLHWRRGGGKGATLRTLIQSLRRADVHPSVVRELLA